MVLACWRGTSLRGGAAAAGFTPGQQLEVLVCQDSVRFCQTWGISWGWPCFLAARPAALSVVCTAALEVLYVTATDIHVLLLCPRLLVLVY
jgi:hypothetical protein